MKIRVKPIAEAVLILIFLTVLPIIGQGWMPSELLKALTTQTGFNLLDLLGRIAVIGVILSILVLLRGLVEKTSVRYLLLSTTWKIFWLFIVFFLLGFGYPETLGIAIIGGIAGAIENVVAFDFRLFTSLATVVVALMIIRSVLQFQDSQQKPKSQES